ncbi:hypothetical protein SI65_07235 [Aspergillus cristatus]|uniref:Fucose-specific lectin n=1 Tax=Aspergillus cristatus TaxID=573508 RepID=A0A1E3B9B0_ASPCR|nr:hypothetical protein SI65_07235 [Aspergillus cristatus]
MPAVTKELDIAVTAWGPESQNILTFTHGEGGDIYETKFDGKEWEHLGVVAKAKPSSPMRSHLTGRTGYLRVVFIGNDNTIQLAIHNGKYWQLYGTSTKVHALSRLAARYDNDGKYRVFAQAEDGKIVQVSFDRSKGKYGVTVAFKDAVPGSSIAVTPNGIPRVNAWRPEKDNWISEDFPIVGKANMQLAALDREDLKDLPDNPDRELHVFYNIGVGFTERYYTYKGWKDGCPLPSGPGPITTMVKGNGRVAVFSHNRDDQTRIFKVSNEDNWEAKKIIVA